MINFKRTLLFLMFISGAVLIQAQDWAPEGSKWTYTLSYAMSGGIDKLVIRSVGDTVIQGKSCHILHKSTIVCDELGFTEFMYSDNGKVYFYDVSRLKFQMLYNFNAIKGDSWVWYPGNMGYQDSIIVNVDSAFSKTINSRILKEIHVSYSLDQNGVEPLGTGDIIESIGDTYYMFPWVFNGCDVMFGGPLRCYDDTILGHYETGVVSSCNYSNLGINEGSGLSSLLNIYPNPFSNTVTIEPGHDVNSQIIPVEILNVLGERVFYWNLSKYNNTIDLSKLQNGIYFLKANINGDTFYYKVIRQ